MARKLPWLTGPASKENDKTPRSAQRRKRDESDSESPEDQHHGPRQQKRIRSDRTPSTSPPPQPPSQHKMRPGLHADDIWVMVEDEFLETAQAYTRHLHHAEYQRLKKEAQTRQSDVNAVRSISRPVDSKTAMREETRRRKDGEKLSKKVSNGLSGLGITPERRKNLNVDSYDDSEDSPGTASENEPWQGTHLQKFIRGSPGSDGGVQNGPRSLLGLHALPSKTRAAAGHQPSGKSPKIESRFTGIASDRPGGDLTGRHTSHVRCDQDNEKDGANSFGIPEDDDLDGDLDGPPSPIPQPRASSTLRSARDDNDKRQDGMRHRRDDSMSDRQPSHLTTKSRTSTNPMRQPPVPVKRAFLDISTYAAIPASAPPNKHSHNSTHRQSAFSAGPVTGKDRLQTSSRYSRCGTPPDDDEDTLPPPSASASISRSTISRSDAMRERIRAERENARSTGGRGSGSTTRTIDGRGEETPRKKIEEKTGGEKRKLDEIPLFLG